MNGVRSTFMRKGYLLTALAAAVLLAASSGTAWAQTVPGSIDFAATTGMVNEGATPKATLPSNHCSYRSNEPLNDGERRRFRDSDRG